MIEGMPWVVFCGEAGGICLGDLVKVHSVLSVKSVLGEHDKLRGSVIQEFEQELLDLRVVGFSGVVQKICLCKGEVVFLVYNASNRVVVPFLITEFLKVE